MLAFYTQLNVILVASYLPVIFFFSKWRSAGPSSVKIDCVEPVFYCFWRHLMSSTGIPGRMNCCLTVMSVCLMAV